MQTYCSDWQVADSACSSTAYFTGTKGNAMTIGVKPSVVYRDCESQMNPDHQASSILLWAQVLFRYCNLCIAKLTIHKLCTIECRDVDWGGYDDHGNTRKPVGGVCAYCRSQLGE